MSLFLDKAIYREKIYSVCTGIGTQVDHMIGKKYKNIFRAEREANILNKIKHIDGVSKIYDIHENIIFMKKIEGRDLYCIVEEKKPLYENTIKKIIYDLLLIIKQIHNLNIIHGDIKLENIIYDSILKQITLIDFETDRNTELYSAPEQITHGIFNKQTDMWSIGVCTYVLFMFHTPFNSKEHIINYNYHNMKNDISLEAKLFVSSLLIKDYNQRMTIDEALNHEWFITLNPPTPPSVPLSTSTILFVKPKIKVLKDYNTYVEKKNIAIQTISPDSPHTKNGCCFFSFIKTKKKIHPLQ